MNLNKKNVLVVGCGISGIGSTKLLEKVGANPILFDENKKVDPDAVRERFGEETKAEIVIGELPKEMEMGIEMVVLSPGVPSDTAAAQPPARKRKRHRPRDSSAPSCQYSCCRGDGGQ